MRRARRLDSTQQTFTRIHSIKRRDRCGISFGIIEIIQLHIVYFYLFYEDVHMSIELYLTVFFYIG